MTTEKPSRNEDEYFARLDAELIQKKKEQELGRRQEEERRSHFMKCPKDGHDLITHELLGVQVDACSQCGGMWLDAGELEELTRLSDQPGMFRRVIRDVVTVLGRGPGGGKKDKDA